MLRIVIGGDICPQGNIESAFKAGAAHDIFHDLLDEIRAADLSIANLECPLVSKSTPITKAGPVLGADIKCIQGFVAAKWSVLNLANNHSFDHGTNGIRETICTIEEAGLGLVGAGMNIEEAQKPFIKEINGTRVVIYSMAEHEFSIADATTPGANPLDLINFVNAVKKYKENCYFIVLIHGGKELYPYPTPETMRRCRFMVDMGADAVICSHTHCPLPWEIYKTRPIVYGLGNLIFEPIRSLPESWFQGYLAKLIFNNNAVSLEVIPYRQSKVFQGAKKMDSALRKSFLDEMAVKAKIILDSTKLESLWMQQCRSVRENYLSNLFAYNRLMSKFQKLLLRKLHHQTQVLRALLTTQCETHQEILKGILKIECSGNKDIDRGDRLL